MSTPNKDLHSNTHLFNVKKLDGAPALEQCLHCVLQLLDIANIKFGGFFHFFGHLLHLCSDIIADFLLLGIDRSSVSTTESMQEEKTKGGESE